MPLGWDIGIEQYLWKNRVSMNVTYFDNIFTNLISYDSQTKKYKNICESVSRGIELGGTVQPINNLDIQALYTFTKAENNKTKEKLLQRPHHKIKGTINYRFFEKVNCNLEVIHVSKKIDYPDVELDGYNILNFAVIYDITKNISLLGRIDNVLNTEYEEVKGYGTAGISGYTGFKVKL
jgi:vitamin B12 transporter